MEQRTFFYTGMPVWLVNLQPLSLGHMAKEQDLRVEAVHFSEQEAIRCTCKES